MNRAVTRQALPQNDYLLLVGIAICVFNSNTSFIIENILQVSSSYDWYHLIDLTNGSLKREIKKTISVYAGHEIEDLYSKLVEQRNRIVHSYQITSKDNEQILCTKEKIENGNNQFEITREYLIEFIKTNEILNEMLNKFRKKNLEDMLKAEFSGEEFDKMKDKVRPAVLEMIQEADDIANDKIESDTFEDVFGSR